MLAALLATAVLTALAGLLLLLAGLLTAAALLAAAMLATLARLLLLLARLLTAAALLLIRTRIVGILVRHIVLLKG